MEILDEVINAPPGYFDRQPSARPVRPPTTGVNIPRPLTNNQQPSYITVSSSPAAPLPGDGTTLALRGLNPGSFQFHSPSNVYIFQNVQKVVFNSPVCK